MVSNPRLRKRQSAAAQAFCAAAIALILGGCASNDLKPRHYAAMSCSDLEQHRQDAERAATRATVTTAGEAAGGTGTAAAVLTGAANPWFLVGYAALWGLGKLTGVIDSDTAGHTAKAETIEVIALVKEINGLCDERHASLLNASTSVNELETTQ